jgi:hypothetical protein
MTDKFDSVQINWSVWQNSPTVSWTWDGVLINIPFKMPPVAIANLIGCRLIAVVGDFDEFGASNLLFYSYDGKLEKIFSAPSLGRDAQFGGITESAEGIRVIVGFYTDWEWKEQAGRLSFDDGTITNLRRSY